MQDKFTNNAVTAIEAANSAAISLSQNYVGSDEKLLLENKNLKELLEAKNDEIAALRQVIDLLKNTENK